MSNRFEIIRKYNDKQVEDLGLWADDPRLMAVVAAKTTRLMETMTHLDRPLPHEILTTEMKPGEAYKL